MSKKIKNIFIFKKERRVPPEKSNTSSWVKPIITGILLNFWVAAKVIGHSDRNMSFGSTRSGFSFIGANATENWWQKIEK